VCLFLPPIPPFSLSSPSRARVRGRSLSPVDKDDKALNERDGRVAWSAAGGVAAASDGDSQAAALARYTDYTQHHISPQRIQHHSFYAPERDRRAEEGAGARGGGAAGGGRDVSLYEDLQSYANEVSLDSSLYLPQQGAPRGQARPLPGQAALPAGADAEVATPFRNYASEVTLDSSVIQTSPVAAPPDNNNFWSRLLSG
jgi:hypothetical protein